MAPLVRFVHCGGFRFDSTAWEGPASWAAARNQDLWQTLEKVLKLCQTEKTNLLFIAGDLFEQETVRKETVERAARSFARLEDTKVFITPGEKDPLVMTSAYRLTEWPGNVHIFAGGLNRIEIPSLGVEIYGSGWTTYRQNLDFLEGFSVPEDAEPVRIMLLYGEVESERHSYGFIPLREDQIAASGLTYLALGHQTDWSGIHQTGETYWADCGSIEPRGFRSSRPHGILLGETNGELTRIKFLELAQRRYVKKWLPRQTGDPETAAARLLTDTLAEERETDLIRLIMAEPFPEAEVYALTLQKLLTGKFRFIEVLPYENGISPIGGHAGVRELFPGKRLNQFFSLVKVFTEEIENHLADDPKEEERTHWDLVQKIGLAALYCHCQGSRTNGGQKSKGTFHWPEGLADDFSPRVHNLQQVGDEDISLTQAWDSLDRAKKRVEEQAESMKGVKAEYEALRLEWEAVTRRQGDQRLLKIEIKNLQAGKEHVTEKITSIQKIISRLQILSQNQDYRELRSMQGELSLLEELRLQAQENMTALFCAGEVDDSLIESLREECQVWAARQKDVDHARNQIRKKQQEIDELKNSLQLSGYMELPENEDQRLLHLEKERASALEQLNQLTVLFDKIQKTEDIYDSEKAKLEDFAGIADVTEADERQIAQIVRRLAKQRNTKISGFWDRVWEELLGRTGLEERLTSRLIRYCQKYDAADYAQFLKLKNEYQNRKLVFANLEKKLEELRKEAGREHGLRKIIRSRTQMLQHACDKVHAEDYEAWQAGWNKFQQKKIELYEIEDELRKLIEELQKRENRVLRVQAEMKEKLRNWSAPISNVDEVLEVITKIIYYRRTKEEAEKELVPLQQAYKTQLGQRNMDRLARYLEPLADLEREACLSDADREAELTAFEQELKEINCQLAEAERSLRQVRSTPVMPDLEKKLEAARLKWQTHENLRHALDATKDLLETSRQKWQSKYGDDLEAKSQQILSRTFSPISGNSQFVNIEIRQIYFAYRLAVILEALEESSDTPLCFSIKEMNEPPEFWEDILAYLQELSQTRQVVFSTKDTGLSHLARKYLSNSSFYSSI
ncbi:MAG: putative metallophosphoesterase YhaO [Candidatus Dichloromethanomonas elyunquensis]|nr:MAG: putative metallophosphoesterase YhaO [Candidatus Dichloromethanomonas elyunquensis]